MRMHATSARPARIAIAIVLLALASAASLRLAAAASDRSSKPAERSSASEAGAAGRPNVLVVLSDDQDAASLEVMENVRRELVAEGTAFTNAFASLPQCCPSRATLLSGQYAHNHQVRDNEPPRGGFTAFDGSDALPVWLREAGYRTGWIGKYMNGYGNAARGTDPLEVPPGWAHWIAPVDHTEYRMYGYTLNRNGKLEDHGAGPRHYQTDVFAREADAFVREGAGSPKPFFLTVAPLAPHTEGGRLDNRPGAARNPRPAPRHLGRFESATLPRPPSFNERRAGDKTAIVAAMPRLGRTAVRRLSTLYRSRLESLLAVDDLIAGLISTLRETDQLRDTLIIYTSDHGFLLGEHRLQGKARLYEEAVRVPLLIRGPGIPAGAERDDVVGNVDLAPTIVAAAGAEAGLKMDGRSLLRAPEPAPAGPAARPGLLLEVFRGGRFAGVRTARYAYLDFGNRGVELYDMRRDPFQLRNRAADPTLAPVLDRHARLLERMRDCSGAACR